MSPRAATESQWPGCQDPQRMIKTVQEHSSLRKLRLMIATVARLAWDELSVVEMREAVEACEGRAERVVEQARLDEYRHRFYEYMFTDATAEQRQWVENPVMRSIFALAFAATYPDGTLRTLSGNNHWHLGVEPRSQQVCHIIREIFGNPFRSVTLSPSWRTDTVLVLARQMYDSRDFSTMPILADALQDAGCDNDDILNHCRQPGEHVRGCWVADLLLGKE